MKTQIINIIISSLLFSYSLKAENVEPEKVQQIALNVFANRFGNSNNQLEIAEVIPVTANGETLYTIFNFHPKGHIVVSNDNVSEPILGYGFDSHISFDSIPPGLQYLLNEYKKEILNAKKLNLVGSKSIKQKWLKYVENDFEPGLKSYTVGDWLLETEWGQGLAYNDSCPDDPSSNNQCLVGCVGVALGQVLNYWGCRVFPDDDISYTPNRFTSSISLNFYDQAYDWDDIGSATGPTAQFLYHCAVAVKSHFGDANNGGTESNIYRAREALINYFGFNAQYPAVKPSQDAQWINTLKNEIDAERPVIYRGQCDTCSVGHAWVVDGYDSNNKFHCNWGWYGDYQDVFYSLSSLTPNEDYSTNQRAIFNIYPKLDACSGLISDDLYCHPDTIDFSVSIPTLASVQWSKSGNLAELNGSTNTTYSVRSTSNNGAQSTITATIKNSQGQTFLTRTTSFWAGKTRIDNIQFSNQGGGMPGTWCMYSTGNTFSINHQSEGNTTFQSYLKTTGGNVVESFTGSSGECYYNPSSPGFYIFETQATNTCGTTDVFSTFVEFTDCSQMMLTLSPNPATNETTLSISSESESETLKSTSISDVSAFDNSAEWDMEIYGPSQTLMVKKAKLKGKSTTIQTAGWMEGVYTIRVKYKDQILTEKLVITK